MLTFALALIAVVVLLTGYVVGGDARNDLDVPLLDRVASWHGAGLTEAATVVTHLGGGAAMWTLALLSCGWFARRAQWAEFALIAGVGLGAAISVRVLKYLVGRERPPVEGQLVSVADPAYPSGHSLGSAAVVGILATLVAWRVRRRSIVVTVVAGAVVFVGLVGLSRVYLGVHWPTDVLAGWTVGVLWVVLGVAVYRRFATTVSSAAARQSTRGDDSAGKTDSDPRRTC
ncbi:phosphatase PAP2 family protein [Nocardia paucivorans]|uniref:phosphatase PAP2 family protein n=1 Tax=Nocardia paucivorans TaxID=114259 RepID=UPI0002DC1473|nr:phosphatase PAP2 family protein [Nocardia paucivorans]